MSRKNREGNLALVPQDYQSPVVHPPRDYQFRARNESQKILSHKIDTHDIIFVTGPAGTGKTFVSGIKACEALSDKTIDRVVVTRPAVEVAGEELGFLPGELQEKFAPWFEPFNDVFEQGLGTSHLKWCKGKEIIVPTPLAYMRGKSYRDTWMIMDEAQNCSPAQMKMFLTRIGQGSKIIVLGDIKQSDIRGVSGLEDAISKLHDLPRIAIHEFGREDIVRHDIVRDILDRYES